MAGLPESDYNDPVPGGLPSGPQEPGDNRAITPPSVIMQKRRERETRREAKREEERLERERQASQQQQRQQQLESDQRRAQDEERRAEQRRLQDEERRAAAAAAAAAPAGAAEQTSRPPLQNVPPGDTRRNNRAAAADAWGGDTSLVRPRQPSGNGTHRRVASQPVSQNAAGAAPQTSSQPQQKSAQTERPRSKTTSSFPHAFERWETLSSHWEGLTGYWIKKLDANKDELSRQPLNQQLARQVTDLSAAGANLFHAVVELQRLRASSERKFQRWFFETRKEQEQSAERIASLEKELKAARAGGGGNKGPTATREMQPEQQQQQVTKEQIRGIQAAAQQAAQQVAQEDIERVKAASKKQLDEMRRELQISRDEARRGWEEIGRLEQSERDRMYCLKRGEPTLVGGVQCVPMALRTAGSTRPATREGGLSSHPVQPEDMQYQNPAQGQQYHHGERARSETDTDPFTESTREAAAARTQASATHPHSQPPTTYPTSSAAIAASTRTKSASPALRPPTSAGTSPRPTATAGTSASGTFPPRSESFSAPQPPTAPSAPSSASTAFYQQPTSVLHQAPGATQPTVLQAEDARSYATVSDDYVMDHSGNPVRDAQGRPIVYQSRHSARSPSEASEDYGQPLHPAAGYAGYQAAQQAQRAAATAAAATSNGNGHAVTAPSMPDYEGAGYGTANEWANVPRHHHPTRLSDVLEEDERSRTSPSRASSRSRGFR